MGRVLKTSKRRGALLILIALWLGTSLPVAAQETYGWYGPYDDGCFYWWDGTRWTGDADCNRDGYTDAAVTEYPAGWYGPFEDGCSYWWDGSAWSSAIDCDGDRLDDSAGTVFPADWYGPFDDNCRYWWDGTKYTGEVDCDGDGRKDAVNESHPPDWYDLYGDGCRYWFDGDTYTGATDCDGDRVADTKLQPNEIDTSSVEEYIQTQIAAINQMWEERFTYQGLPYDDTKAVITVEPIEIACSTADGDQILETEDWILYCSWDQTVYFGPENLELLTLSGIGAVQFTAAHEVGHHVQRMLDPNLSANYDGDTVAYEDQATCMAGVWFNYLDAQGIPSDINAAMTFLSTATDDVHGSGEDQLKAFLQGYHDPGSC